MANEEYEALYLVDWGTAFDMDVNIIDTFAPEDKDNIEVVTYCKDCKFNNKNICELFSYGRYVEITVCSDDYCSFGGTE